MEPSPNYNGKKILIGVTGSIACYKTALLIRLFKKAGAEVKVIMTSDALEFISPLTLATLSKNPVYHKFVENELGEWNNHVEMGLWADVFIIAPATANSLGHMAQGLCNNLLLAVYLSARCPVFVSPAMDLDMFRHPATQSNLNTLNSHGVKIIDAEFGDLASGLEGKGRMAEPETIFEEIELFFRNNNSLSGKKAMVTAGPTHEPIDPVRFISNRSSGKMGYAIAKELIQRGCVVTLITGPSSLVKPQANKVIEIQTAAEMYSACKEHYEDQDIVVLSAAVADFTSKEVSSGKIKKSASMSLNLQPTIDIAKTLGESKNGQFVVGFALETDHEIENAIGKLKSKNFDIIVLNSLKDKNAGFGVDTNKVTIIDKMGKKTAFGLKTKKKVAIDIVNIIENKVKKL